MPSSEVRHAGLVEQAIEHMRAAIAEGKWAVGNRIPAEPDLCQTLGVGRNTVREAVRALAHSGLLEVRRGDGTFVRATSELSGALRRIYGDELRDVLEVRRMIEVQAARFAAVRRDDAQLQRLREAMTVRDAAATDDDPTLFVAADTEFHRQILAASHNQVLIGLYCGLDEAVKASVAAIVRADQSGDRKRSHAGILAAIEDQDPDRAAAQAGDFFADLLREHA